MVVLDFNAIVFLTPRQGMMNASEIPIAPRVKQMA
jgi:hypothetical protein